MIWVAALVIYGWGQENSNDYEGTINPEKI